MPSNSTYACLNCQFAWKTTGGLCSRCGNNMVYMGKRWRAPKSSNNSAWRKMREGFEAGAEWREWALWDQPRQIIPCTSRWQLTPEDYRRMKENQKKAKENIEYHQNRWYEEMQRLMADTLAKKAAIKAKIKEHRKAKRLAERSKT